YEVEIIQNGQGYDLVELCQRIGLREDFVLKCVEFGIAEVRGEEVAQWRFPPQVVVRLQRAWRLQRDLDINCTGLGLVLDLLDDIDKLRAQLSLMEKKLQHWEP